MMNKLDQKMNTCKATECVSMTKREFLAYAFNSKFKYTMIFAMPEGENPKQFCEKQKMQIYLFN